jgi:hypothetical protein
MKARREQGFSSKERIGAAPAFARVIALSAHFSMKAASMKILGFSTIVLGGGMPRHPRNPDA